MRRATGPGQRWRGSAQLAFFALALLLASCTGSTPTSTPGGAHASRTPTSAATATATLTPMQAAAQAAAAAHAYRERQIRATANWYLSHMSLNEKLGQMFLIETVWQGYNSDVDGMVAGLHAGAMILYAQNMANSAQLKSYIASIQEHAKLPLLVTMDEEGGVVDRLGYLGFDPPLPSAQYLASTGNPKLAYQAGQRAAAELLALGINTNLAPVADVRTDPNAVEYTRLFGDDPRTVATYAGAFLQGSQDHGVVGCVKHWPGIGGTTLDPHKTLPVMYDSLAQLNAVNFAPFKALVRLNPGMVMVTHVIVQAIDPNLPATLSPKVVNGVLRGQLGYQGVVMTDSLYMKGISDHYTLPEAGVLAVEAGDDLLEGAFDTASMAAMVHALKAAVSSGRISRGRIDESVRRILMLKARFGMLPLIAAGPLPQAPSSVSPGMALAADADVPRAA